MRTSRKCTNCCEIKSIPGDFYTYGKDADGRQRWKTWCKQCELEDQKIKRLTNPEYKRYHDKNSAAWQRKFKARYLELMKRWRERQREARQKASSQKASARGLTLVELIERKNQARDRRRNEQR